MPEGYIVHSGRGEIAGIVVRQQGDAGYQFHASSTAFQSMNGQVFSSPLAAERAVRGQSKSTKPPPKYA